MKPNSKVNKSPYNQPPPVKLRAQIIPQKVNQISKQNNQLSKQKNQISKPLPPKNDKQTNNKNNSNNISKDNKNNKKVQSSSSSSDDSDSSSYDSQVEDFANQFYDQDVKKADKSLQLKKDNNQQNNKIKKEENNQKQKSKKPQTQWDKIQARLKQLKPNFNDLNMQQILFKKKDEKKLKQIAQFLSKKHKQKRQFMKKLKKIKNSQKQRKKIEQQMIKKKQQQEHNNRMKQIRKLSLLIKQKIQKKKQQEQSRLQDIEQFYQQFNKKYKNKKLYKLMQLSDKIKRNKQIQKEKEILRQIKHHHSQIITYEEIFQFKKRHQQLIKDLEKVKQTQKQQKLSEIAQKNKQLRDKIYIGSKYLQMQQQINKKQKARGAPKQKLNKIKQYNSYIKQNFMPLNHNKSQQQNQDQQINQQKQQQQQEWPIVQIDGKVYRKVKKDRYLKGQKIGQMIVNVPVPKTQKQMRMVGNSYLQQLKLLPKKRHSTSLDLNHKSELTSIRQPIKKQMTPRIQIPKIQRKELGKINLRKNANRYEIQNLINSLKSKDKLISRQQLYLKAINKSPIKMKQQLDQNLLDNIEKKINLLGRL